MRKKAQRSIRQPEYVTLHQRTGSRSGQRQRLHLLTSAPQRKSKRVMEREEGLSRRAQLREQRDDAKRRRQWLLALALVFILVVVITVARLSS